MADHSRQDISGASDNEGEQFPYAARAAMCFMSVDGEGDDSALYKKLCDALRADSRVETLNCPEQDPSGFYRPTFSMFGPDDDQLPIRHDHAPDPSSHTHAFNFREPIIVEVHSPRRLQPTFEDFDRIPADRYWAAWD